MAAQKLLLEQFFRGPAITSGLYGSKGELFSIITYKEESTGRYISEAWKCWGWNNRRDFFLEGTMTCSMYDWEEQHKALYTKLHNKQFNEPSFSEQVVQMVFGK